MPQINQNISDTGLYEEEVFKLLANYELSRVQRYPNPVTMLHISLNLDQVKPPNAGKLKQLFVGILNTSLRISDIPAHYGNDFLVLMPSTDEVGAQIAARRFITRLRGTHSLDDGKSFKFVIHIGIATHSGGKGVTADTLINQAESALQEARQAGPHSFKQYSGE